MRRATYGAMCGLIFCIQILKPFFKEAITKGSIITPTQSPIDTQDAAGQIISRGPFVFVLLGGVCVRYFGITAPYRLHCTCGRLDPPPPVSKWICIIEVTIGVHRHRKNRVSSVWSLSIALWSILLIFRIVRVLVG